MSWLYSRVLVEEYLGDISSDGELSALSSGNPTPQAYCAPDKMTLFSRLSRYGMMYRPLTESRGEELLMLYLAGFHAKTLVPLEMAQALMENDQECGEKWHGLLAKFDRDTHSWKTVQCSFLEDLDESLETLPRWGMTVNGLLWEQPTLERRIKGTESGLWRTPDTGAGGTSGLLKQRQTHRANGQSIQIRLVDQVNNPRMWPTPQASDNRDRGNMSNPAIQRRVAIGKQIMLSQSVHPTSGQLNPDWVEWLMNWPIKWSDLNGFNKQEFQRWQEASAKAIQSAGQVRTMWWDSDPSQTPLGQQPVEQPKQQHSNSLPEMSWDASCERKMERSQQGSDLSLLRKDFYIQEAERKDLRQRLREQTCLDEAQIVPRVSKSVAARVDRLKAIGNGQVPLCAATAWRILNEPN